jgi:DNA invertase Pin-like site-specific DNA recombinase
MMIIGYARVSTTEQNLGLEHDDLKPAFDASVDQTDARLRNDQAHLPGGHREL